MESIPLTWDLSKVSVELNGLKVRQTKLGDESHEAVICVRCGNPANRTQRLIASEERIVIGAGDIYEPRCRRCHEPMFPKEESKSK